MVVFVVHHAMIMIVIIVQAMQWNGQNVFLLPDMAPNCPIRPSYQPCDDCQSPLGFLDDFSFRYHDHCPLDTLPYWCCCWCPFLLNDPNSLLWPVIYVISQSQLCVSCFIVLTLPHRMSSFGPLSCVCTSFLLLPRRPLATQSHGEWSLLARPVAIISRPSPLCTHTHIFTNWGPFWFIEQSSLTAGSSPFPYPFLFPTNSPFHSPTPSCPIIYVCVPHANKGLILSALSVLWCSPLLILYCCLVCVYVPHHGKPSSAKTTRYTKT